MDDQEEEKEFGALKQMKMGGGLLKDKA